MVWCADERPPSWRISGRLEGSLGVKGGFRGLWRLQTTRWMERRINGLSYETEKYKFKVVGYRWQLPDVFFFLSIFFRRGKTGLRGVLSFMRLDQVCIRPSLDILHYHYHHPSSFPSSSSFSFSSPSFRSFSVLGRQITLFHNKRTFLWHFK